MIRRRHFGFSPWWGAFVWGSFCWNYFYWNQKSYFRYYQLPCDWAASVSVHISSFPAHILRINGKAVYKNCQSRGWNLVATSSYRHQVLDCLKKKLKNVYYIRWIKQITESNDFEDLFISFLLWLESVSFHKRRVCN